jgi:hypothetical protein
MTKGGTDRVIETTLAGLRECRDRMDFPPPSRQEAEARFQLVQACVEYAERFGCILSEKMPAR